ncbi:hypothetical protein CLOP_g25549, partial [Closterium sp. NIES-67]
LSLARGREGSRCRGPNQQHRAQHQQQQQHHHPQHQQRQQQQQQFPFLVARFSSPQTGTQCRREDAKALSLEAPPFPMAAVCVGAKAGLEESTAALAEGGSSSGGSCSKGRGQLWRALLHWQKETPPFPTAAVCRC